MTIQISSSYGFDHNWTLVAYGKSFYLGQDVKFCSRVLGMSPRSVVDAIGDADLGKETTKKKLAKFICNQLNLTRTNVKNIQQWELCSQ